MCAKCASAIDDDFRGFSSIRLVVNIIEMILLLLKYSFSPPKRSPTYEIDESKNIDVGTIHNWICHTTACIQFNIARNYIQTVKTRLILQRSNSLVMTQTTQKQCKFPFLPSFVVVSVPIPVGDACRFCRRLWIWFWSSTHRSSNKNCHWVTYTFLDEIFFYHSNWKIRSLRFCFQNSIFSIYFICFFCSFSLIPIQSMYISIEEWVLINFVLYLLSSARRKKISNLCCARHDVLRGSLGYN